MTRADRLASLLKRAIPDDPWVKGVGGSKLPAPYVFDTLPDGSRRLMVENRLTGDRIGVVGKTIDDVLDQLEARLPK